MSEIDFNDSAKLELLESNDEIRIIYKLIEFEESDLLYNNPKNNYTKKLISSII